MRLIFFISIKCTFPHVTPFRTLREHSCLFLASRRWRKENSTRKNNFISLAIVLVQLARIPVAIFSCMIQQLVLFFQTNMLDAVWNKVTNGRKVLLFLQYAGNLRVPSNLFRSSPNMHLPRQMSCETLLVPVLNKTFFALSQTHSLLVCTNMNKVQLYLLFSTSETIDILVN